MGLPPIAFLTVKTPIRKRKRKRKQAKEKAKGWKEKHTTYRNKNKDMEEVMMMMISSPENPRNETISHSAEPITASTCPRWKLYDNPFYYPQHHPQPHQHQQCQSNKHCHPLRLPRSTRKIAASFWDLTFFTPMMQSELEFAQAQIIELKAELEYERKTRKKAESMNKRLAKELAQERRGREAMEKVCEELAKEISSDKVEINMMKREMEEERKMLRMAEVLREERVQMKLTEAKFLFEEKLSELERTWIQIESSPPKLKEKNQEDNPPGTTTASDSVASFSGKSKQLFLGEKTACNDNSGIDSAGLELSEKLDYYDNNAIDSRESTRLVLGEKSCDYNSNGVSLMTIQRKASPEPENPHIKRGIKGFVEFPRVVRAMGSKSRHWGTKLECQKSQLRILLKQRSPIRSNNLILG
ncbi:protein BRANCHLESS TRICHOME [Juglans microcarpa x Juglans regia]|uniref:protein BRANCHLESS TRICHOME n=1 Tax=Juglans microcarpa x Juglans regia TaxID=2249226 RepID=UPI001B7EEF6F|nr:protein BRANCHLESS TRICHOME [Juglans microcarpa x Juglans regia]